VHNQGTAANHFDRMHKPLIILSAVLLLASGSVHAQESNSMEETLLGVWKMEPRILRGGNYVSYQEEAIMSITERMPDGRYLVIVRMTSRIVTDEEGLMNVPGCEEKTECFIDDATEGIGSSFRSAFYVDYFADNWIDDLFTVKGNVMDADDGNGPIRFNKVEEE
jgi:hypothetical protein